MPPAPANRGDEGGNDSLDDATREEDHPVVRRLDRSTVLGVNGLECSITVGIGRFEEI